MILYRTITKLTALAVLFSLAGCRQDAPQPETGGYTALADVPAVRLNYRYEADVPAPADNRINAANQERNAAVQTDFDQNRPQELLDKTLSSPDGKRVLAIYHLPVDLQSEFRLDMYSPDGTLLRKVTAETMAVHFPDTIVWSPDSLSLAFVAMLRGVPVETPEGPQNPNQPAGNTAANTNNAVNTNTSANTNIQPSPDANVNTSPVDPEANPDAATPTAPTPAAPAGVLTFRSEQIYLCNADGDSVKPITQNEGLIYFYYVWSPDGTMLAALAATSREWLFLNQRADLQGEIFVPVGRPRIVEKTGRERRLDDGLTAVQPVWSPDSAKVAAAFDTQVRVYDSGGNSPTQAAIPLRNNLLISSKAFDDDQARKLADANVQTNTAPNQPLTALPDEKTLVSYNPVVALSWPVDSELYFQTAYIKRMKNEADSVTSFPRWHRLILTPQAQSNKL
ncbi:MAG: hypothetical protein WKF92_08665 [Pyrinomonadaceae bacterium]